MINQPQQTSQMEMFQELAPHFDPCLVTETKGGIKVHNYNAGCAHLQYRIMNVWFDGPSNPAVLTSRLFNLN